MVSATTENMCWGHVHLSDTSTTVPFGRERAARHRAHADHRPAVSRAGARAWHAGALLRSGSLLVVDTGTGSVGAAHALGGLPGHGARYAERALTALLAKAPRPAGAAARA